MRIRPLSAAAALVALLLGAPALAAQAGTGTVEGRVLDAESQAPLSGATVSVNGTSRGAVTAQDGRYRITAVPAGERRVRASMLGRAAQERAVTVSAGATASADFSLAAQALALQEVVAVGYGTQRRRDVTGSVASVRTDEVQRLAPVSVQQALQGTVAGVQVTQGDAAPGGGLRVQIRGTNSTNAGSATPLYVIDGIPVSGGADKRTIGARSEENLVSLTDTNPLSTLSPADIESIEILKDASATAIYGSRGANGVVIITTKRGRRNRPGQFSLNVSQGYSSVVRQVDVLNAYEFATFVNQAYINAFGPETQYPYGGRPGSRTPEEIRAQVGAGTNWQDEVFQTALLRDVQLGWSGGDDRGSFGITGNLLDQEGVIRGSGFTRGGLRVNLDRDISPFFRISSNLAVTRSLNDMVRSSTISGYRAVGIVRQAITYAPMQFRDTLAADPRAEDAATWTAFGANPLRYTDEVSERDQITRGIGGLKGVATLGRGFALDLSLGGNYERRSYAIYFPRTVAEGRDNNGTAAQSGSEFSNILNENLLRYNGDFGGAHRVDAVAGFTYQYDRATWSGQEVHSFPDDILGSNVLQNGTNPQRPWSGLSTSTLASWLGRVNYSLLDRYLFTATFRADGSSKFAENNKWATFPAFALAWRLSQESFLRDVDAVSDLKVRASYGRSGNQAISSYQSLAAISGEGMTLNEGVVPAYVTSQLGNPNLKWETTDQYDVGVDFGFLDNRVTGSVDYYRKNTHDLLQNITLAGNTGFTSAWINSGEVSNRGVEAQIGVDVIDRDGFTWNVSANAARNRNRIESLGPVEQQFAGRLGAGGGLEATPFIQRPGLPIGTMWGYRTDGLIRSAADSAAYAAMGITGRVGDVRYRDADGDGRITADDQTIIGDANADWTWGLTNRVTLGRFDLSALLIGVHGNDIINAERMRYLVLDGAINVPSTYVENAFDPVTNPGGRYPQVRQDRKADARFSDLYVEDGSFVRLKNVQLGYNFRLPRAQQARVYLNAINLLTWTDYTGFDPEVSAFNSPDRPGVDLGSYPQQRTISIGVSTTF